MINLQIPVPKDEIRKLHMGDVVNLSGTMITARDAAHKFMIENFINKTPDNDLVLYEELKNVLDQGVIYHCGPIVARNNNTWKFVAAGPTTSIREEPYQGNVIKHFNISAVIGKGGMGDQTLQACKQHGCVYLHAIGGAAALIASTVINVHKVYMLEEFGSPEAMWIIKTLNFPAVVTMDTHGNSLHKNVETKARSVLETFLNPD